MLRGEVSGQSINRGCGSYGLSAAFAYSQRTFCNEFSQQPLLQFSRNEDKKLPSYFPSERKLGSQQSRLTRLMSHIDGNTLQPLRRFRHQAGKREGHMDVYFLIPLTNFSGRVSPVRFPVNPFKSYCFRRRKLRACKTSSNYNLEYTKF